MFTPIIYGFAFAYLLSPIMNYFEKKWFRALFRKSDARKCKKRNITRTKEQEEAYEYRLRKKSRALGVAMTMFTAIAVLVGIVSAIVPGVVASIGGFIERSNDYIYTIQNWNLSFLDGIPDVRDAVHDFMHNAPTMITGWLEESILPELTDIAGSVASGVWTAIGALLNVLIGLVISVYFLYGKELFSAQGKKSLYSFLPISKANLIIRNLRSIHKKFGGFVTGVLINAFILGTEVFILMTIFQMPYAPLISVLIGITNIIPYFGPIIGAVPSALLILMEDPMTCLYFIIMIIIVQQIDGNIVTPRILGDNTGLTSFWIIFALLLGQNLFGFVGLIIGVPMFAFIYAVFKARVARTLKEKGLPSDSDFYRRVSHIENETGEIVFLEEKEKPKKDKKEKKRGLFVRKDKTE
jgi:predicted PurR-regulated permease PerM